MEERSKFIADMGVRIASVLVSLLVLTLGYLDYTRRWENDLKRKADEEASTRVTRTIQARAPFLQKRLELYFEATHAASRLATLPRGKEWEEARHDFLQLFWGKLSIVESREVEAAMVRFKRQGLDRFLTGEINRDDLEQLSLQLAHVCREDLRTAWDVSSLEGPRK